MTSSSTAILILAAGSSSRLGLPKQLLQLDRKSLLRRIAETALELHPAEVVVVLGFEPDRMKHELHDLAVKIVLNHDWQEGIASSLRHGMAGLSPTLDGALIALCDQPFIPVTHLSHLISSCSIQHPIAATSYEPSPGVPACFHRTLFPELLTLTGDSGARRIIEKHIQETTVFPCTEASIDIDTASDYRQYFDPGR
jgi:molybdenum cofactor cytidylyltransferase